MNSRCKYRKVENNRTRANLIKALAGSWLSRYGSQSTSSIALRADLRTTYSPATITAPTSMEKYPAAVNRFFESQPLSPPKWLYQVLMASVQTVEARTSMPYFADNTRVIGTRSQRTYTAFRTVIRPAGRGRSGLFLLSSSGSWIWLDIACFSMCVHIQRIVSGMRASWGCGAVAKTKRV